MCVYIYIYGGGGGSREREREIVRRGQCKLAFLEVVSFVIQEMRLTN